MSQALFYDKLVCRTALFPIERDLEEILDHPLDNRVFMQAVYFSSPEFHSLLVHSIQEGAFSERTLETLNKYFKRSKFRSTPFGLFGGVGVVRWNQKDRMVRECFSIRHDLEAKAKVYLDEKFRRYGDFYLNPTIYKRKNEFRYYGYDLDDCIYFKLRSLTVTKELSNIIKIFGDSAVLSNVELQKSDFGTQGDFEFFLDELLDSQFILSTNRSVIGEFYSAQKRFGNIERLVQKMLVELNGDKSDFNTYLGYNKFLQKRIPGIFSNGNGFHSVRVDQYSLDQVSKKHQQNILRAYGYLQKVIKAPAGQELDTFVRKFNTWYESQIIPLLQIFDPDSGFDEYISMRSDLVKGKKVAAETEPKEGEVALLNQIFGSDRSVLEVEDRAKGRSEETNRLVTAKFQVFQDDMIYIERFIGKSPLSYFSRFSGYHDEISNLCREIGREHYADSEDRVFAEIISVSEYMSLNVINAPVICNYAISIFESPVQQPSRPLLRTIPLNDLMVGIRDGRPVLYSKRLNKEVVPVLTNAYNYSRSTLPVYRFLCSMARQHEGTDLDLGSYLQTVVRHNHIPRIVLNKNIILSKEKWIISKEQIRERLNVNSIGCFVSRIGEIKLHYKLRDRLEIVVQDRPVPIDLNCPEDLVLLGKELFKQKTLILEEHLLSSFESAIRDRDNLSFSHELLGAFKPGPASRSDHRVPAFREPANFYPFQEGWLYIKIYCNRSIANRYLAVFYGMIRRDRSFVEKWFFIRYEDPEFHLRVRVKFLSPGHAMAFYHRLMERKFDSREFRLHIFDLALCSYQREIMRYERIGLAEELFSIDSYYSLEVIKMGNVFTERDLIVLIVHSIRSYLKIFSLEKSTCLTSLEGRRKDLKERYNLENESFADLFNYSRTGWQEIYKKVRPSFDRREIELRKAAKGIGGLAQPHKLFVDILHLLCNRMLEFEQNQKEFVVVTLLLKYLRLPNSGSSGL